MRSEWHVEDDDNNNNDDDDDDDDDSCSSEIWKMMATSTVQNSLICKRDRVQQIQL
jgi:hypothetical protein